MAGAMQTNYKAFSSGRSSNLKKKKYMQMQSPLNQSTGTFYRKNENYRQVAIGIPVTIMDKGQASIDSFNFGGQ
jgi:hypothetical protein